MEQKPSVAIQMVDLRTRNAHILGLLIVGMTVVSYTVDHVILPGFIITEELPATLGAVLNGLKEVSRMKTTANLVIEK